MSGKGGDEPPEERDRLEEKNAHDQRDGRPNGQVSQEFAQRQIVKHGALQKKRPRRVERPRNREGLLRLRFWCQDKTRIRGDPHGNVFVSSRRRRGIT